MTDWKTRARRMQGAFDRGADTVTVEEAEATLKELFHGACVEKGFDCKEIDELKAKLAAAENALLNGAGPWLTETIAGQKARIAALETDLAMARAENKRLFASRLTVDGVYTGIPPEQMAARIAELEAELKTASKGCFAGPDGGDCPWLNDQKAKRRAPPHDKAHCPAVVRKGEYDRDTCYIDHDKPRRRPNAR
jgi:hypothetical protein